MNRKYRTILIVDDCLEDRETYRRYLLQDVNYKYTILEAELGAEGLILWQQYQPDGILLDYCLPDIDGLEFLVQLQAQKQSKYLPVVIVTGQGDESLAVQVMKAGASDYLIKRRVTPEELRLAMNSVIEKAKLHGKLQKSEERLKLALESAVMGTWEWNIENNNLICSDFITQIFDLPDGSCLSNYQSLLELVHPDDREALNQSIITAIATGKKYQTEFRVLRLDGAVNWVEARGKVYYDIMAQPTHLVGTFMDISKSKQAELEKQQHFCKERLVNQISQQVSKSLDLEKILNTTVDEVRQFLQCDRVIIFRFQLDGNGQVITESVTSDWDVILGSEIYDPCFDLGWAEEYKRGRIRYIENIYTSNLAQCHIDLLAKFQVKANLVVPILQGENLWGLLIAHQCSASRQWQQVEVDLLQILVTQVGIAIQQSTLFKQLEIELTERKHAQQEQQRLLTLEAAARTEAERANRMKDEFLAVLSHELRSPLNPILGWATVLLKNRNLDATKTTQALKIIERNAKLQVQLIEDLLDVSRILHGKFNLAAKPVNLVDVISSALETVRLAAEVKAISLKFIILNPSSNSNHKGMEIVNSATGLWDIESEIKSLKYNVLGDASRLQQIFWNLLSNAVKFTPHGGAVEVKLEPLGDFFKIIVTDTGKGISPEFLPHVFEYFRQADSATTRKFGGLGLGLAIVRQLVELHGGNIQVESTGEEQGATFTVMLTRIPENFDGNKTENKVKLPTNYFNLKGVQILVVDDDEDSLNFIKFVLEEDGAIVTAVASAFEALKILSDLKPDILVSDIGMPGMDGYALLRQIRAWQAEAGGEIPAVALTAYAGEIDKIQALAVGFQAYLTKPIEPETLVTVVAELAEGRV
ncbi:hybrid sensor histidine kinase/response regulator [Brunnivagina elsteri]|uniref:histidine kinase n=1 Tax=Brunnivagina elsteri CCALA 953 TaxID=987040 RepID=A0A2A2TLW7_9CYAN|nr:response regulator [Calothrix elsteri]PAX58409.1 hybrid sensor histidine kinase/response regulator [Calothrix elsteri CCALA 953]